MILLNTENSCCLVVVTKKKEIRLERDSISRLVLRTFVSIPIPRKLVTVPLKQIWTKRPKISTYRTE